MSGSSDCRRRIHIYEEDQTILSRAVVGLGEDITLTPMGGYGLDNCPGVGVGYFIMKGNMRLRLVLIVKIMTKGTKVVGVICTITFRLIASSCCFAAPWAC